MQLRRLILALVFCPTIVFAQDDLERARKLLGEGDATAAALVVKKVVDKDPSKVDALLLAGQIFLELETYDSAAIYAKRAFSENDSRPDVVRTYALALAKTGDAAQATVLLRKLLKKNQEVQNHLALVDALIEADSVRAAELVATTAKKLFPKSAESYLALGNIYFNYKPQAVYELAKNNYEEAIKLDTSLLPAHINLAQSYWSLANAESDPDLYNELFKRCLLSWNEVSKLDPNNARAFFEQGKIFYLAKRYSDAAKMLVEYRKLRPVGTGQAIASWYLGNAFYEINVCDSARQHLEDAGRQIDTLRNKTSLLLARCSFRTKKWKESASFFTTADIAGLLEPLDVWYFGTAQVLAGDTAKAIETMWKASMLDPKQCALMFRYGLLLQSYDIKRSNEVFSKRLENCSDSLDARILVFIGNNYFQDSAVDSAAHYYQRAIAKDSTNCYFASRMAEIHLVKNEPKEARTMLEDVAARCGQSDNEQNRRYAEQALLRLCNLDLQEKNYSALIGHAKLITGVVNARSAFGWLYLGVGNQGSGSKDEACRAYKKVVEIDPANKTAKDNLKSLGC